MTVFIERFSESLFYMTDALRADQLQKCSAEEIKHQKKIAELTSAIARKEMEFQEKIISSSPYEGGIITLGFILFASYFDNNVVKEISMIVVGVALGVFISRKEIILEKSELETERKKIESERFIFEINKLEQEKTMELNNLELVSREKKKWEDFAEVIEEEKQKRFYSL